MALVSDITITKTPPSTLFHDMLSQMTKEKYSGVLDFSSTSKLDVQYLEQVQKII